MVHTAVQHPSSPNPSPNTSPTILHFVHSTSATFIFLFFLQQTRHTPAWGLFQLMFPLPGKIYPQILIKLKALCFFLVSVQVYFFFFNHRSCLPKYNSILSLSLSLNLIYSSSKHLSPSGILHMHFLLIICLISLEFKNSWGQGLCFVYCYIPSAWNDTQQKIGV